MFDEQMFHTKEKVIEMYYAGFDVDGLNSSEKWIENWINMVFDKIAVFEDKESRNAWISGKGEAYDENELVFRRKPLTLEEVAERLSIDTDDITFCTVGALGEMGTCWLQWI